MTRTLLFLLFSLSAFAASVDPIDPLKLPSGGTWNGKVGVVGGIPLTSETTVYTNFTSSATAAQIQSGINNCPSNQAVHLASGTYSINAGLTIDRDGVTLLGDTNSDGTPATILNNTSDVTITIGPTSGWDTSSSANWTTRNVSSGATRGSTSVVVSSTPTGLAAGMIMWLASTTPDGSGFSDLFTTHPAVQVVTITSVSGTTVNFDPPFNADYWGGTILAAYHAAGDTRHRSGLKNLKIWRNGGASASGAHYVQGNGADQPFMENVHTYWVAHSTYHTYWYACNRVEIRRCEMDKADLGTDASSTYAIVPQQCGGLLVVDNYFHYLANVMPIFGMSCGVFAYNYINDLPYSTTSPDWLSQIVYYHGSHSAYNLFEGNWCAAHYSDATPGSKNTLYFRERMRGYDPSPTQGTPKASNTQCVTTEDHHENIVIAGCVLGEDGYHTSWNAGGHLSILDFDATSATTLATTNNYDTVGDAVRGSMVSGQELPPSYLYSSRPPWWGVNFAWPMVDPTNSTISLAAERYTNFPAGYRAAFVTNPPTSAPLVAVTLLPIGGARLRLPR